MHWLEFHTAQPWMGSISFDPTCCMGDYDKSKALASLEVIKAAGDGLDAVIVCPTGVIGPHDYKASEMGTLNFEHFVQQDGIQCGWSV